MRYLLALALAVALALAQACEDSAPGAPDAASSPSDLNPDRNVVCQPNGDHVPFVMRLPDELPGGLHREAVCLSLPPSGVEAEPSIVQIYYQSEDGSKRYAIFASRGEMGHEGMTPVMIAGHTAYARKDESRYQLQISLEGVTYILMGAADPESGPSEAEVQTLAGALIGSEPQ